MIWKRLGLEVLIVVLLVVAVRALLPSPFSQSGFIVSGNIKIDVYEETKTDIITELEWGNLSINQICKRYVWLRLNQTGVRVNYFSDNPSWMLHEWFYESSPGRWSRWANNSFVYISTEWIHVMARLTVGAEAPEGPFTFNSYLDKV